MSIEPFTIHVPQATLDDLHQRLERTRWPDEVPGTGWDYGTNLAYMQELVTYWRTAYDWRAQERYLNSFSHYRASVDGFGVHFLREPAQRPNAPALLLLHGWPGTFYEFHKVVRPLSADFEVIVPSLPGYGFSDRPRERGWDPVRMADLFVRLMTEVLGHERFGVHGGDWGAIIGTRMAARHPQHVLGLHLHMLGAQPNLGPDSPPLSPAEEAWRAQQQATAMDEERGYQAIQGTRPQTLAYALHDSPAGLAAWIIEKYRRWSDCNGELERRYTKDELLTTIMLYWVTETANSASRIYYESRRSAFRLPPGQRIEVPTGIVAAPGGLFTVTAPREWCERVYNVRRYTRFASGGHFLALEEPEALIEDMRAFFRDVAA